VPYIIFFFLTYLVIGFQIGLFPAIEIVGGMINLIVIILISTFFLEIEKEGLIFSIVLAIAFDIYFYLPIGLSVVAVLIIYALLNIFRQKIIEKTNYFFIASIIFAAVVIFDLILFIGNSIASGHFVFERLFLSLLPDALINFIIAIPLFIIIQYLIKILAVYRIIDVKKSKIKVE